MVNFQTILYCKLKLLIEITNVDRNNSGNKYKINLTNNNIILQFLIYDNWNWKFDINNNVIITLKSKLQDVFKKTTQYIFVSMAKNANHKQIKDLSDSFDQNWTN